MAKASAGDSATTKSARYWRTVCDRSWSAMSAMVHPAAMILSGMAKWISGADVQWLWRPAESSPRVYFANHSSHLDALVLLAALPAPIRNRTHPVAAQEYWQGSR